MNRALKTRTNLRDAKKKYDGKLPQISKVPAMNSFCLYLKISVLSFMNKALQIQPSIHWDRLPKPTPPGASCYIYCINGKRIRKFFDFSVRRSCLFSHSPKNTILRIRCLSLLPFKKRSISLSNQLNQYFPPSRVHFSRYVLGGENQY